MVEYYYDAWGNHKVVDEKGDEITDLDNIGNLNPFRYRGYYYDTETGLYFLQTRYYDPEVGRFLNRDSVEYADPETINGLNLYAYCLNNPVEYADPTGCWSWDIFLQGLGMVATAITAIALSITTFGAGIPLSMSIIAGVTIASGVLSGINGIATIVEAGTSYNFIRDGIFKGDKTGYIWYSVITNLITDIGISILGAYHMTGRYKAAKYGQGYLGKGYKKVGKNRWVSADGLRQMRWDTTHHIIDGIPSANHFNLYAFTHSYWQGGRNPILQNLHLRLTMFDFRIL